MNILLVVMKTIIQCNISLSCDKERIFNRVFQRKVIEMVKMVAGREAGRLFCTWQCHVQILIPDNLIFYKGQMHKVTNMRLTL